MSAELGRWLRSERLALDWSQEKLEIESGVSQSTISALEAGKPPRGPRRMEALRQIITTLDISLLEAYHRAGLLQTTDERDQDAIEAALLIRQMQPRQRAEALSMLREKLREG